MYMFNQNLPVAVLSRQLRAEEWLIEPLRKEEMLLWACETISDGPLHFLKSD